METRAAAWSHSSLTGSPIQKVVGSPPAITLPLLLTQGLLRELLSLCPADRSEQRSTVLRAVGASLRERSMHEDAAVAFVAAGDLRAALQSYRAGGHWRMVMALAGEPCSVIKISGQGRGITS